jgi:hydroxymethylbilane synthase
MKISSRQSPLAQIQAYQVGAALQSVSPGIPIEYFFRQSLGDQNLNEPLWKIPEKGVFTEDFYLDLVDGKTDMVVHSWKDLPTETKEKTQIAATLPRADQRDLLLFKKSSFSRSQVKIFSSSPRRTVNLKEFLPEVLPWNVSSVEFTSVRGNISTRVQKLLENPEIDGLIVAKAALDRLLSDAKFPEAIEFLRAALLKLQWMVLPLSENPNAAAQGALAVEVARNNSSVQQALDQINCKSSYLCAEKEREILKHYGGGCHLAIGVSVLQRPYGRIEIVKGLTPGGERVQSKTLFAKKARPSGVAVSRLEFHSERHLLKAEIPPADAYFISRAEALTDAKPGSILWTAGLPTWKKLASMGHWVHGSAEGLGESENPQVEILAGSILKWAFLSHDEADFNPQDRKERVGTYHLDLSLRSQNLGDGKLWQWKSGSEFQLALEKFPALREHEHICGPGRSFEKISQLLGTAEKIYVELNDGFVTTV